MIHKRRGKYFQSKLYGPLEETGFRRLVWIYLLHKLLFLGLRCENRETSHLLLPGSQGDHCNRRQDVHLCVTMVTGHLRTFGVNALFTLQVQDKCVFTCTRMAFKSICFVVYYTVHGNKLYKRKQFALLSRLNSVNFRVNRTNLTCGQWKCFHSWLKYHSHAFLLLLSHQTFLEPTI